MRHRSFQGLNDQKINEGLIGGQGCSPVLRWNNRDSPLPPPLPPLPPKSVQKIKNSSTRLIHLMSGTSPSGLLSHCLPSACPRPVCRATESCATGTESRFECNLRHCKNRDTRRATLAKVRYLRRFFRGYVDASCSLLEFVVNFFSRSPLSILVNGIGFVGQIWEPVMCQRSALVSVRIARRASVRLAIIQYAHRVGIYFVPELII